MRRAKSKKPICKMSDPSYSSVGLVDNKNKKQLLKTPHPQILVSLLFTRDTTYVNQLKHDKLPILEYTSCWESSHFSCALFPSLLRAIFRKHPKCNLKEKTQSFLTCWASLFFSIKNTYVSMHFKIVEQQPSGSTVHQVCSKNQ